MSEQIRYFRHWLLLVSSFTFFTLQSYWISSVNHQILCDDLMMYFSYRWPNVFTNVFFCWWPPRFNCWQKIAQVAVIRWCDSWRPRDDEMLSPWPPPLYATDPIIRSHATWIQHNMRHTVIKQLVRYFSFFVEHQIFVTSQIQPFPIPFFVPDAWCPWSFLLFVPSDIRWPIIRDVRRADFLN